MNNTAMNNSALNKTIPLLELKGLSKQFLGKKGHLVHAVCNVSLKINRHETLGLVGESGSGKSTTGQLIMGLHQPTGGEIFFQGNALKPKRTHADLRAQALQMQMIFQNPYSSFNPRMSVREIIAEPLKLAGLENNPQKVNEWITRVGLLPDHLNRYPHEFSGGQRQRIAIARALITEPKFVVCDEPVSALDLSIQAQIVNMLQDLKQHLDLSLLFIAHDLSMVRHISNRIAVMYKGSIVELGTAESVFDFPKHPYTQLLIASNLTANPAFERHRTVSLATREVLADRSSPDLATDRGNDSVIACPFVSRCSQASDRCHLESPQLNMLRDEQEHFVACHLYTV